MHQHGRRGCDTRLQAPLERGTTISTSTLVTIAWLLCFAATGTQATEPFRLPLEPDAALKRLIGTYGDPDAQLILYEDSGFLKADGHGLHRATMTLVGPDMYTAVNPGADPSVRRLAIEADDGGPRSVLLDGVRLPARDIGEEVVRAIRTGIRSDAAALRDAALVQAPPVEPAAKRRADLVSLTKVDPAFKFDIRYATTNNFMGFPLYERAGAYLQRPAAEALRRAGRRLAPLGYGLLIYDGYRPWFVTRMFWDATPPSAHNFVADPSEGSRHNRGCAVDLTLYDLRTGHAVEMTGRYDEMSVRSSADFVGGTARQRALRDLLRQAMEEQGFTVYPDEWWHFDFNAWRDYPIGNVPFRGLGSG